MTKKVEVLPEEQHDLRHLMHQISERRWACGWMGGLEFHLWADIIGDRSFRAGRVLTPGERLDLLEAARKAEGWWYWDDGTMAPVFKPIREWMRHYLEYTEK